MKFEFLLILVLKKFNEGVVFELKYFGFVGIVNLFMVVFGRWMLVMVSVGVVKVVKFIGWMVNFGVVIFGILIWGRVKLLSLIGLMVNGGVVILGVMI